MMFLAKHVTIFISEEQLQEKKHMFWEKLENAFGDATLLVRMRNTFNFNHCQSLIHANTTPLTFFSRRWLNKLKEEAVLSRTRPTPVSSKEAK